MIYEVEGDILKSGAAAIAHGVAPDDDFHSGLALALREQWPAMYKDFRHFCHTHSPHIGQAWSWGGAGGTRIVALLTQEPAKDKNDHPGKAKLSAVNHALRELRRMVETEGLASIALPRVATGVGGLDWTEVKPLIEHHLGDLPIPVYLYTVFHPGVQATEPTV